MERLLKIEQEIEKLQERINEKDKKWDFSKSWYDYQEYMQPEWSAINALDKEKRLIMPYQLSELSECGDVMTLEDFIEDCECGLFIDYDGFGYYLKDDQQTDIEIHPSDVEIGAIRKEFSHIIWFNK